MSTVYFINRLVIFLLITLLYGTAVVSQTFSYTDKESFINRDREQTKLFARPDGKLHLWRWGNGRLVLNVYDQKLSYLHNKKISQSPLDKVSFIQFDGLYYVWLAGPQKGRLYLVKDDTCIDKSAALTKLPLEQLPVTQIVQSNKSLFFIQQDFGDSNYQSKVHITALDPHLQYINSVRVAVNFTDLEQRNFHGNAVGNQLFLVSTAIGENSSKLTLYKVNVANGKVLTMTIPFTDKFVFAEQLQLYGTGFLLRTLAAKPFRAQWWQNSYTCYLMRLDSNLNITSSLQTNQSEIQTTILPDKTVQTINYKRFLNPTTRKIETQLLYQLLDTNLHVIEYITKPITGHSNTPAYMFSMQNKATIFYEEEIKTNKFAVHSFPLSEREADNRLLQLQPKFRYLLRHAVRTLDNTFVMPYFHKYSRIGLVQVKVL